MLGDMKNMSPIRLFYLKSRQQGVSTWWLIWWLDDTLWTPNTVTGILAHKHDSLKILMEIIHTAIDYMPKECKFELADDNKESISFPHQNSKIFASLSIRSTGLHNLHVSEWCHCKDEEVQATLGAASTWTNITGETTGNGVGNDGYEKYYDAKKGDSEYKAVFFPWFIQEEYKLPMNGIKSLDLTKEETGLIKVGKREGTIITDEHILWRRRKKGDLRGLFRQEYPETDEDAFLTSGHKFFEPRKIHKLLMNAKEWERKEGYHRKEFDFICFHKRQKYHTYAAGADTSEGKNDFSVLKIIDVTEKREVFTYRARVGVDTFYKVCNLWGREYNDALLAVERNNHGHAVILGLIEDKRYPNMYYKEMDVKKGYVDKKQYGWETGKISRPLMLDQLKLGIEGEEEADEDHFNPQITMHDKDFFNEALTFEQIKGKFQASEGKHDDIVIASAIGFQMFLRLLKHEKTTRGIEGIYVGNERETRY